MIEEIIDIKGLSVPEPVIVADDTVTRLFSQGYREKGGLEYLQIIGEAREALAKMPTDKKGIVLGSGGKTRNWREKGWSTLDVLTASDADYIENANYLDRRLQPESQDFVLAEFINLDSKGDRYAVPGRLFKQTNEILSPGGIFILKTASFDHQQDSTIPNRHKLAKTLTRHGFQTVIEVHPYKKYGKKSDERAQKVTCYAKKVAEGYDKSRIKD